MPLARIAAGQVLHRVHAASASARWYGRKDATWRWDDPARNYGVLYLGKTLIGSLVETALRSPHDPMVLWDQVQKKRAAGFETTRPLRLAKLHGPGLAWFRTTVAGISADFDPAENPGAYTTTQRISAMVHATTDIDGIQYRSRFDNDQLCVAFFERADDALRLTQQGVDLPKLWVKEVLAQRGYTLLEV